MAQDTQAARDVSPGDLVKLGGKVYLVPYICGACAKPVGPFSLLPFPAPQLPCGHDLRPTASLGLVIPPD